MRPGMRGSPILCKCLHWELRKRLNPLYARSKAAGEKAVLAAIPTASIVRPSIVFGPQDDFFNRFASMSAPGFPLIGGGQTKFQPVYVEDVADAIIACLNQRKMRRGRFSSWAVPPSIALRILMKLVMHEMGVHKGLVPVPFFVANIMGFVFEILGKLPIMPTFLTRDQVRQLRVDNVLSGTQPGF